MATQFLRCSLYEELLIATKLGMEQCDDSKWLLSHPISLNTHISKCYSDIYTITRREIQIYALKQGCSIFKFRLNTKSIKVVLKVPPIGAFFSSYHPAKIKKLREPLYEKFRSVGSYRVRIYPYACDGEIDPRIEIKFMCADQVDGFRTTQAPSVCETLVKLIDIIKEISDIFITAVKQFWDEEVPVFKSIPVRRIIPAIEVTPDDIVKLFFGGANSGDQN